MRSRIGFVVAIALAGCGGGAVPPDETPDAPPGPFDVPAQCTSNGHWKFGNQRSPLMYPGEACIACHVTQFDTPRFSASGTVYATGHEPDNCNGATGVTVVITDASGAMVTLMTNDAGNYFT